MKATLRVRVVVLLACALASWALVGIAAVAGCRVVHWLRSEPQYDNGVVERELGDSA